jgi:hypothetical protein
MNITMDRYEANWWYGGKSAGKPMCLAKEGLFFRNGSDEPFRAEQPVIDQELPPFVIGENSQPVEPSTIMTA